MPGGSSDEIDDFIDVQNYNQTDDEELESDAFDEVTEDDISDASVDETPRKKQSKSRKRRNLGDLILREVEEVSGDEDEEDTLVPEDGYKEMEKIIRDRENFNIYNKRRSSRIDYAIRDADQDQLEELAKRWTGTTRDPSLWMVRCQMGQEANAVLALMRKSLFLKKNGNPIDILSAVYQNGIKGFIYVEAHKQSHVKSALQGLSYFTYGINKQRMVPLDEMPQVLKVVKETILMEPDSWIRVKRGEYRNDLAQVESVDRVKNSAVIKLIPRIDYQQINKSAAAANAPPKDNDRKLFRAEPALFSIDKIRREGGILTQDAAGFYVYAGNRFKDGLLYKRFPIKSLIITGVKPRLNELEQFKAAVSDDRYSNDFAVTLNKSTTLKEGQGSPSETFKVGDLVQVASGELMDSVGHVISLEDDAVQVQLNKSETESNPPIIEVLSDELRKFFAIGDNVAVVSGEHQGQVGMVVRVEHPFVIVFSNDSFSEMKVFAHNLHKTTSRFSGVDSSGQFQVGEFIRIDSNTVGCITKIQNDTVEFINQMGKNNTSKIHNIQKYFPKRGFFRDKFNSPINIGDNVRVVGVDSLRDIVGQVKMLVYEWAFIYSPMVRKERGMFTCKSRNLIVEKNKPSSSHASIDGGNGLMSSVGFGSNIGSPAALSMSPRITGTLFNTVGGGGTSSTLGNTSSLHYDGSNPSIAAIGSYTPIDNNTIRNIKNIRGKTVRIVHGPYKGYYGIVRDCSGQLARIELHTNSKTISVNMSHFTCEGDERPLISAQGQTPLSSVNTPYSAYGNKSAHHTPHHHQGSETPGIHSSGYGRAPTTPSNFDGPATTPLAYGSTTPYSGYMGGSVTTSAEFTATTTTTNEQSFNTSNDSVDTYNSSKLKTSYHNSSPDSYMPASRLNYTAPVDRSGHSAVGSLAKDFEVRLVSTHHKYPDALGRVLGKSANSVTIQLKNSSEIVTVSDAKQLTWVTPIMFDKIEVVSGEHRGDRGRVLSVNGDDCTIELHHPDGRISSANVPLVCVAKISTAT